MTKIYEKNNKWWFHDEQSGTHRGPFNTQEEVEEFRRAFLKFLGGNPPDSGIIQVTKI